MRRFTLLLLAVMTLDGASAAMAKSLDLSRLNRLEGVSVYSDEQEGRVVIRFAKDWKRRWPRPVFYEKSIQIDIDGAYVTPAKKTFKLDDKLVPGAAAYQVTPQTTRLRLFLDGDPREYSNSWRGTINGNLMILVLRKPGAPAVASEAEEAEDQTPIEEETITAPEISAPATAAAPIETERAGGLDAKFGFLGGKGKAPAVNVAGNEESGSRPGAKRLSYSGQAFSHDLNLRGMAIRMITSLSLVLALVFVLAWAAKKYMGRINGGAGPGGIVRVLATAPIDVKKRVALIDVAGEVMVLGLSGENITLLGTIDDEERADLVRRRSGLGASAGRGNAPGLSGSEGKKPTGKPAFITRALGALRIGRVRKSGGPPRSLLDEDAPDTFAGALARADGVERGARVSRDELLRQVTGAIKARKDGLRFA